MTRDDLPRLEFWPEHGAGPLWDTDGRPATGDHLRLPPELVDRLEAFTAACAEERLPIDGDGDPDYLALGAHLLADVRVALAGRFVVVVTETWWAAVSPPPGAGPSPRP